MTDKNIYQPPKSNLVHKNVPTSFYSGKITAGQLNWAGWLSIFYLILSTTSIILSFSGELKNDNTVKIADDILTIASTLLWIYLLLVLKKFVEERFELASLDVYVKIIIVMSILLGGLSLLLDQQSETGEISTTMIISFVLFVPYGIILILFGKKLLSIKEHYQYMTAFSWTIIISGICMASVILFLLAVPVSIVSDIFLALLFFKGKNELILPAQTA